MTLETAAIGSELNNNPKESYSQKYRHIHHQEILKRYRDGIPKAVPAILKLARENPRYEEQHVIRDYVICRVCGAKAGRVTPVHLSHYHDLTTREYMGQFPGAPMVCPTTRRKISSSGKNAKSAMRHRPRHDMSKVKGHKKPPLKHRLIVPYLEEGKTTIEIAKILGYHHNHLKKKMRDDLGLENAAGRYDLGRPVTRAYLSSLCNSVGIGSLVDQFDISHSLKPSSRIPVDQANSVIHWRDSVISGFLELAKIRGHRGGPNLTRAVAALFPDMGSIGSLWAVFTQTREKFLPKTPNPTLDKWQDWLCEEAMLEKGEKRAGRIFTKSLFLVFGVSRFVDLDVIRDKPPSFSAVKVIALRLGVGRRVIANNRRARPMSSREMRDWILRMPGIWGSPRQRSIPDKDQRAASSREKSGRPRKEESDKKPHKVRTVVEALLSRMVKGYNVLRTAKKQHPDDREQWERVLARSSFKSNERTALLNSKTPEAAAIRLTAIQLQIKLKTARNHFYASPNPQLPE